MQSLSAAKNSLLIDKYVIDIEGFLYRGMHYDNFKLINYVNK